MPLIQGLHQYGSLVQHIRRLTSLSAYDVIHVEHSFMAPYMRFVSPRSAAKKVLSMHNIESRRFERELRFARGARRLALWSDQLLFDAWEKASVREFDAIAAVSTVEQEWVKKHAPAAAVEVVPNGVNLEYFSPAARSDPGRSIIFTGLMNYPPNADAVVWFCDAVLPIVTRRYPDVCFRIVGDKPPAEVRALAQRPNVQVTGRVADVRPYLTNCTALVVPVRSAGGTRLKILEAMAMGRAVVSTRQGAEGLDVSDGVNLLLGDAPEEIADHLLSVLTSPELGHRLGCAGRRLVEERYDWQYCLSKLDVLYGTPTGGARPS
jgi:glycosyltransferase involved in cell wall biosynthesis